MSEPSAVDDDGYFDERVSARYDESGEISGMFDPAVVEPVVDFLAELAGRGRALELARAGRRGLVRPERARGALAPPRGARERPDFLVLYGEALPLVEGQERTLRQWDFVHCPPTRGT